LQPEQSKKQKILIREEDFHPENSNMKGIHINIGLRDSPVAGKVIYRLFMFDYLFIHVCFIIIIYVCSLL